MITFQLELDLIYSDSSESMEILYLLMLANAQMYEKIFSHLRATDSLN